MIDEQLQIISLVTILKHCVDNSLVRCICE